VEQSQTVADVAATDRQPLYLRVRVGEGALAQFSYSVDNARFIPVGQPFQATAGRWVGAQVGLFSTTPSAASRKAYADFDYFKITP
jgi:hypothetical protein